MSCELHPLGEVIDHVLGRDLRELLRTLSVDAKSARSICQLRAQVTSPQLALLETTMAKMERVDAWIFMMGGGNGVDVFMVSTCFSRHRHQCSINACVIAQ